MLHIYPMGGVFCLPLHRCKYKAPPKRNKEWRFEATYKSYLDHSELPVEIKGELTPSALYLSEVSLGPLKHIYAFHNVYICPGKVISCIY